MKRGVARPARFERATTCLEGRCSIQLSYERNLIREPCPLHPIWVLLCAGPNQRQAQGPELSRSFQSRNFLVVIPESERSIAARPGWGAAHRGFSERCGLVRWGFVPKPMARRNVGAWALRIGTQRDSGQRIFTSKQLFTVFSRRTFKTFAQPFV